MRARILLVISWSLFSFGGLSQSTFSFSDSVFEVGQTKTFQDIRFELNKHDLLLDSVCKPYVDSILSFLLDHPEIIVEVGVHKDSRGWKYRSSFLTPGRAENLRVYFVEHGAGADQIVPRGYECHQPIHSDPYINQFKETDKAKFHELHQENRRVVLKILKVD